mgnify:CR=1 FL=1
MICNNYYDGPDEDGPGEIAGPEYMWVTTDEHGCNEVYSAIDYPTYKDVLKRVSIEPVIEDRTIELRFGYAWRLHGESDHEWRFSYHDDIGDEINEAHSDREESWRESQADGDRLGE